MKTAEQALLDVLNIVRRYLPPDGIPEKDALCEIIACVDPWPLATSPAASQPDCGDYGHCEGWFLPRAKLNAPMLATLAVLLAHAKRARWTSATVRKDAVETVYEADWIKWLTPINRAALATTQPPAASQPSDEGEREIIATYKALHANKLGAHWLWVVIEQIAAGVPEDEAMEDFGYFEFAKSLCPPKRPAGEVAKDARHPLYVAVMAHCDDLDRCVPMLRGHGLKRLANEVAKAAKELRAAICGPSAPPVLPTKE